MPCFSCTQAYAEGIIIGRLLAGYGDIEVEMCACLIAVKGTFDIPIRTLFGKSGADNRLKVAKKALQSNFANAHLLADLTEALADMNWCRQIRNQYSHCQWFWDSATRTLNFVNLEELAKQPNQILLVTANKHPIDVPLLQRQEGYFWYVKQCFMYLSSAYHAWDQARARGAAGGPSSFVYAKPPKIARPPEHN
jgi:hypothetical protein